MTTNISNPEFKVTRTYGLASLRSVRWTHNRVRMSGWDIVYRLAFGTCLPTSEFVIRYSPGVYADHVEFSARNWMQIETDYVERSEIRFTRMA